MDGKGENKEYTALLGCDYGEKTDYLHRHSNTPEGSGQ